MTYLPTGFLPRDPAAHPAALYPPYKSSVARAPSLAPLSFPASPSEISGPVFDHNLLGPQDNDLIHNYAAAGASAIGPRIIVHGRLSDEYDRPVRGALIEVWQANAGGRYRHKKEGYQAPLDPNFGGCGRMITDDQGHYAFRTVQPAPYPWPNGPNSWRPAHIHFSVFGHGFAQRLITQMYFQGDPLIPLCPIGNSLPTPDAVDRLIAPLDMAATAPMDALSYRFDIVLRGARQTLFENQPEGM